jgi:acyl carrier protein
MNKMDEIKEFFEKKIGRPVQTSETLKSLGLDSLDIVEMLLDLEDKCGIQFESDEMGSYVTVQDLYNGIDTKLKAKK